MANDADVVTLLRCSFISSLLSKMTPRSRADTEASMTESPIFKDGNGDVFTNRELMWITSVLESFSISLLLTAHDLTSWTHLSSLLKPLDLFNGSRMRYSWVSSAYIIWLSPWEVMISPNGAVYIVKIAGPNTEPCGTPSSSKRSSDSTPPISIHWVLPRKYAENHFKAVRVMP